MMEYDKEQYARQAEEIAALAMRVKEEGNSHLASILLTVSGSLYLGYHATAILANHTVLHAKTMMKVMEEQEKQDFLDSYGGSEQN